MRAGEAVNEPRGARAGGRAPSVAETWALAVALVAGWREGQGRADHLLSDLAGGSAERAPAQNLFFAAVRHWRRIDEALRPLINRAPRVRLQAVLALAAAELIENTAGASAAIVDNAVEQAKRQLSGPEAGLVNAVLRRVAPVLRETPAPADDASVEEMASYFSHPTWLVKKWFGQFGPVATRRLLEWNQSTAQVQVRWRVATPPPAGLESTPWPNFFRLAHGRWADIQAGLTAGQCYLQDPATRLAPALAAPRAGEDWLELCAAPGGKTFQLADAMGSGRIVAVDRVGGRMKRFEENVARWRAGGGQAAITLIGADVLALTAAELVARELPGQFDGVLIDVPCSNTGVIRHRVDSKWRLKPGEFDQLAEIQERMLAAAAAFVRPGGRVVYSTCSLEPEENEQVIESFLESEAGRGFVLEDSAQGRPWEHGHDGAGAFRLRSKA
ncbi:MAG: RsmB/NOP family class I SAM-dependent RNA methyltransferase [Opitutaceae bacterium]|nr:RsmB/NOP family class I SAM-dependent RNA methyltransferase [Opitutaceae bacterium]